MGHEEALRIYSLCHHLTKLEILEGILRASHQRSLNKFSENENEEEFTDYTEAPDIICECWAATVRPVEDVLKHFTYFVKIKSLNVLFAFAYVLPLISLKEANSNVSCQRCLDQWTNSTLVIDYF